MKICAVNNFCFKSNFFTISKEGMYYDLEKVSTDNKEKLGREPVLLTEQNGQIIDLPMTYDGKYYTTNVPSYIDKYKIFYRDTQKYENDGKEKSINILDLTKKAIREDRKYNNLDLEYPLAKGEARGKVFVNTFDIPHNVPAILILDEIADEEVLICKIPDNVKGVITSSCQVDTLSHAANLTRNRISSMSIIWDEDKFNDLKKQEGKYLSVNNEEGILNYEEIEPSYCTYKSFVTKVTVPKLENTERLLNFDELTLQNCGNKGFRIGVMQRLARDGILEDITVPNGFVIPEGYLKKFREYITTDDFEEEKRRILEGFYTQDTDKRVRELGLPRQDLIIRSNFNTEDMGSFSSAGIYVSEPANNYGSIILNAEGVAGYSLNSAINPIAKIVHKKHGIEDKDIQPSVIVQERIHPDYTFTVYSDDGDNNILINLSDYKLGYQKPANDALIKYNKDTKELKSVRKESPRAEYLFDESGKIIDQKHFENRIDKNWSILTPLLGIVTSGAMVLEKLFMHPQDIEGGIGKDGKVYFWQTRDIVAKAVKKI